MNDHSRLGRFGGRREFVRSVDSQTHRARATEKRAGGALDIYKPLVMRSVASHLTNAQKSPGKQRERTCARQCAEKIGKHAPWVPGQ